MADPARRQEAHPPKTRTCPITNHCPGIPRPPYILFGQTYYTCSLQEKLPKRSRRVAWQVPYAGRLQPSGVVCSSVITLVDCNHGVFGLRQRQLRGSGLDSRRGNFELFGLYISSIASEHSEAPRLWTSLAILLSANSSHSKLVR